MPPMSQFTKKKQTKITKKAERVAVSAIAKAVKKVERFKPLKRQSSSKSPSAALPKVFVEEARKDVIVAKDFAKAIEKPFSYIPRPLGCSSGSAMFTNSYTVQTSTNASGCLAATAFPRGQYGNSINTTITSSVAGSWGSTPSFGDTQISTNFSEGRLMAMGVRWHIRTADTTVPGFVYAGLMSGIANSTDYSSKTGDQIAGLACMQLLTGRQAGDGCITWRPMDSNDGEFSAYMVGSTTFTSTNMPIVYFTGWPASTSIKIDWIWHIEVIPNLSYYSGMPSILNYDENGYEDILSHAKHTAGFAWDAVVALGRAVATRFALRTVEGLFNRSRPVQYGRGLEEPDENSDGPDNREPYTGPYAGADGTYDPSLDPSTSEGDLHDELRVVAPPLGYVPDPPEGYYSVIGLQTILNPLKLLAKINALERRLKSGEIGSNSVSSTVRGIPGRDKFTYISVGDTSSGETTPARLKSVRSKSSK